MDKGPAPFGIDQMMLRRPSSLLASRLQPSIIALHQRSITTVNAQNFMKASMNTVMGQRRLLSSAAHDHTEDLKHFEVHSPQDVKIVSHIDLLFF